MIALKKQMGILFVTKKNTTANFHVYMISFRRTLRNNSKIWRERSTVSNSSGIYEEIGPAVPDRPIAMRNLEKSRSSGYLEGKAMLMLKFRYFCYFYCF